MPAPTSATPDVNSATAATIQPTGAPPVPGSAEPAATIGAGKVLVIVTEALGSTRTVPSSSPSESWTPTGVMQG